MSGRLPGLSVTAPTAICVRLWIYAAFVFFSVLAICTVAETPVTVRGPLSKPRKSPSSRYNDIAYSAYMGPEPNSVVPSTPEPPGPFQTIQMCSKYDDLRIRCPAEHFIVIHSAIFTQETPERVYQMCNNETDPFGYYYLRGRKILTQNCTESIHQSINNKCSGQHQCLFVFRRDHLEERRRRCRGDGIVIVQFRCITERSLSRYCSARVRTPISGYIASPSFPHYYPQLRQCNWTLEAQLGQTIRIHVLDVFLMHPRFEDDMITPVCNEQVSISEGESRLLTACGDDARSLQTITSRAHTLIVNFFSIEFAPRRGFLLYYEFLGCPTLPAPPNAFLVNRNETASFYKCKKGYFFADNDLLPYKYLYCFPGETQWNDTLTRCASRYEFAENGTNIIGDGDQRQIYGRIPHYPKPPAPPHQQASTDYRLKKAKGGEGFEGEKEDQEEEGNEISVFTSSLAFKMTQWADVIVPAIIMTALIIGNIVVVIVIFHYRKRQKAQQAQRRRPILLVPDDEPKAPLATI